MNTFGIMTLNVESEASYINEIAARSHSCGMECFHFLPSAINPHTQLVQGRRYCALEQNWTDEEFPIPSLIYDRCFYGDDVHSKQCIPIVTWLKSREEITFLGFGLPNKLELYKILSDSRLAPYLPHSQAVKDCSEVISALTKQKKAIIKPINGSQGYGIYYLKKNDKTIHVKTEKNKKIISRIFPNESKLFQWLQPLINFRPYLIQPYLELSNTVSKPFDIRILLQKDEQGVWVERGKGIRIGNTGGILSNLSAGGSVVDFTTWSSTLSQIHKEYICSELNFITTNLPEILEREISPLFEIGIDIGVAKNGALWILDVNSKPGRKVILKTEPELKETLYQAPLLYGEYLIRTESKERKSSYEKTLYH
ncbi:YheC/YheD family protein [Neobacillus sp. DY30]|uniref:YheC/YheD family endospore coat-associated protein n=1 Tax=Neobacillus sp. DY30 TaxID=3047871 RepID=UPI0024BFF24F|nr:YheC/YheD family protein [Neobacillus sp. DY30]WHY02003.1 YheC/YheD family protein [Neobacillus sp. DY30]